MASSTSGSGGENGANGSNGAGSYDELEPDDEAPPEPLPAPPAAVAELVAACMRFIAQKYKVALDGTPETMSLVDQYVREARTAVKERPEAIEVVAPAIGAYIGEVMRQSFGAVWHAEGGYDAWRLYCTNVFLSFNPIGIAREAISMEDEEGWHAHFVLDPAERDAIQERLAVVPDVDQEEYYLPTTRFDVITVVVETLRARAEAAGVGDVRFTRDDYT